MRAVAEPTPLTLADRVCLALVEEGVGHGWAVGSVLAEDGELGRIWHLSRPLVYRSVETLADRGLLVRAGGTERRTRERVALKATAKGRTATRTWLGAPVEHLRDVRTELLLKLELLRRRGIDLHPLVEAQRAHFAERFARLTDAGPAAGPVELWRREQARSVRRFLDLLLEEPTGVPARPPTPLRLSARNQVRARVVSVQLGDVLATVRTVLPDGQFLTAVVTRESVADLDVVVDDEVLVIVKSTEVMLGRP